MNLILIDIGNTYREDIRKIVLENGILFPVEQLFQLKNRGIGKVWIDKDLDTVFSYEIRGTKKIELGDYYKIMLNKCEPLKTKAEATTQDVKDPTIDTDLKTILDKKEKNSNDPAYTVDQILDKISMFGVKSLTDTERAILKELEE